MSSLLTCRTSMRILALALLTVIIVPVRSIGQSIDRMRSYRYVDTSIVIGGHGAGQYSLPTTLDGIASGLYLVRADADGSGSTTRTLVVGP